MKKLAPAVVVAALLSFVAFANPIKTWLAGDVITAADLNSALGHIHNTMVGAHGPRLVNADVSASAAISLSKIQYGDRAPAHAWGVLNCTTSCSTAGSSYGLSTLSGNPTTGTTVNLSSACSIGTPVGIVVSDRAGSVCYTSGYSASTIIFTCSTQPVSPHLVVFCY